jgi:hypothetical protein
MPFHLIGVAREHFISREVTLSASSRVKPISLNNKKEWLWLYADSLDYLLLKVSLIANIILTLVPPACGVHILSFYDRSSA